MYVCVYVNGGLYNIIIFWRAPSGILSGATLVNEFFIILESYIVPSHPSNTYVNFKSNMQAANIFYIEYSFLPQYLGVLH